MKLIKLLSGSLLLAFGGFFLCAAILIPFDPDDTAESKTEAILGCLLLGVPSTSGGGFLIGNLRETRKKEKRDRIQSSFYRVLEETNGNITTLRLAMAAEISGKEAEKFLNEKAQEFNANFQVTEDGGIVYQFDL
jgi:cobalamin biosynthesis protein CbiG